MKNLIATIRSVETEHYEGVKGALYDLLSLVSIGTFVAVTLLYAKAISIYLNMPAA